MYDLIQRKLTSTNVALEKYTKCKTFTVGDNTVFILCSFQTEVQYYANINIYIITVLIFHISTIRLMVFHFAV